MSERLSKAEISEILNDTNFIFSKHYCFQSILGRGGFGIVVQAISKVTLECMAVKVISKHKKEDYY